VAEARISRQYSRRVVDDLEARCPRVLDLNQTVSCLTLQLHKGCCLRSWCYAVVEVMSELFDRFLLYVSRCERVFSQISS
jgi:hypothetical protein